MRKVLSFVLVLTLVLSSFSMAFAADSTAAGLTDIDGNANADAIQVAYDLEIVTGNPDGTFLPEKAVTRAEFAAMITRALAIPDSALAGYTSTSFKDTAGYSWAVPYLAFCQSKGIMLGDGQGNVMPGKTITVNEAMTMALRAIGYTANSAMLVGAWPANYVSIAQNEDLYDDVAADTTVNKASAAQIIYNLLTVQKVAVNTDGETVFQQDSDDNAYNLLNTNLGCTENKKITLGIDYTYDNSVINLTGRIGAYGTAYENDDEDLVAFIPDSTALTGKIDDGKFKVGDTKYDLPADAATISAVFVNTDSQSKLDADVDFDDKIDSFADANADGGSTVTIYVDLSGKKIKEVYSIVAWSAENAELASSDVQDDIADLELLGEDFADDDDGNIDPKAFQLVGVASLDDIAEDDVVYVYVDDEDNIRKVAVGTETVEGVVDEREDKDDGSIDTLVIDGTEYSIAPSELATTDAKNLDVDSEGIFYLDYAGKIFDFEGTSGNADTYAVIKASYDTGDAYDEGRIKLYLSDDTTKTYYLEDKLSKIDVIRTSSVSSIGSTDSDIIDALSTTGSVIGYSLNSDGDIDTLDVTTTMGDIYIQSSKVLKFEGEYYDIDSQAVVFTYSGAESETGLTTGDYDVATLADMKKDETSFGSFILNEDGDVAAIILNEDFVDSKSDDVYAVVNKVTNTKTDDDPVFKLTGLIDGDSFTKKTDDDNSDYKTAGKFSVYAIAVDGSDIITDIRDLSDTTEVTENGIGQGYAVGQAVKDKQAGYLTQTKSGVVYNALSITVDDVDDTVITDANGLKWTVDDDAVVYIWDRSDKEFTKSSLKKIDEDDKVSLFDTKDKDDVDGIATVVIFEEIDD